jgi:hypothetical protein
VINEQATVVAVSRDGNHRFSKPQTQEILLLAGLGVHGDAHAGTTVQHRSRVAADPTQPNLRQVHLLHAELFAELDAQGFAVQPGQLGWPIATGVIEGACRHIVADRFDVTGARWALAGAEAILKLRALRSNGDFQNYWTWHLDQERQRVHESRYLDGALPRAA